MRLFATLAYGTDGAGLDLSEGLEAGVSGADVFAVKGLKATNFRFDLMGQAHESLPLDDPEWMKKAGKTETGTYCAVPMVHDGWTIEEAVPFWYICENDWTGHVDCKVAYEGAYDRKDYYGWQTLSECLQKPGKMLRESASAGDGGGLVYFYRLDFVSNFNQFAPLARTAIVQASIDSKLMLRYEAPRVRLAPAQEACCAARRAAVSGGAASLSLAALVPVGARLLLTTFRIFVPERGAHEAVFLTRQELKRIKLG